MPLTSIPRCLLSDHTHILSLSIENRSLALASMASGNNGTWEKHATVYAGDMETHHLLYRLASPEDIGMENDGTFTTIVCSRHIKYWKS